MGSGSISLSPLVYDLTLPFERKLDVETISQNASRTGKSELEQTALTVMNQTKQIVDGAYENISDYVENNTLLVIGIGIVVLLFLIIIIVILVFRCTRESRIRKRRQQEQKERLRMEEEIDRKTASEIEQELREAMERERLQRERQAARMAEERRQEEKLRETEKILEEINKK